MKKIDFNGVEEPKEYTRLVAGGYICRITLVEDVPEKEYLKIEYDIAVGDMKDYFKNLNDAKGFWAGKFIKSYKETALSFFKGFTTAVEKSNAGYKFDNDEKKLIGKLVGLVIGEEGYIGNDGSSKNRLYVKDVRSVDSIKNGDFEVPAYKPAPAQQPSLSQANNFMPTGDISDDEMPFR
ncbi:MAG TPA: hypothetical protein VN258_06485 [Mobilitalea sp.]|nr:hypothetical protein [Mobilitalea sp.]